MNRRLLASLATFVVVPFGLAVGVAGADLPSPASQRAADPAVTWGRLDNGLRYALMSNSEPANKVSLLLQVQAGSLEETDSQRGAAHLLEHMAFASTTHYPAGQLAATFEKLGLRFNVHLYAEPGLDESVYRLDLPDAKPETIATGLGIMADWAGGMLLLPAEIDEQRQWVLSELQRFHGPDERNREVIARASYAGTIIGERPPMGLAEAITTLNQAQLKDYYDTWYRPEAMTLVVVGAIEPTAVAAQVREQLGKLADRAPARSRPDLTSFVVTDQPVIVVHTEPDATGNEVLVERVMAEAAPPDGMARERDGLCRLLAEHIFNRRIQAIVIRNTTSPVVSASMFSYYDGLGFAHAGVRADVRRSGGTLPALALTLTEYRRLQEYGPTAAELTVESHAVAADLDAAVDAANTRLNADLAGDIHNANKSGLLFQSPAQHRDLLEPMLQTITPGEIMGAFKAFRSRPGRDVVTVIGPAEMGANGERTVQEAYAQDLAAPVSAPAEGPVSTWAYGDLPEPSGIIWMNERPDEAAQGIKVLWSHTHGLRMQVRRSDAQPGLALVSLRFEINNADVKSHRPVGIGELIERGLVPGGLGRHTTGEVNALFADSSVRFTGIHVSDDAITYTASCNGNDLTRALQLLRAYYGDPGWREEAEAPVKQAWLKSLVERETNVDAQVERHMEMALAGPYAWRRPATADEVKALSFADAQDWLNKALDGDILTITVVGDVPADAADTVALWFGQYQVKARFMQASIADARNSAMELPPLKPGIERLTVSGPVAQAVIHMVWPTDDRFDVARTRQMDLLASCLGERLQAALRQKFGTNVAVKTWDTASGTFRSDGQIHLLASITPGQADPALAFIRTQAAALAGRGINDKLLDQVKVAALQAVVKEKQSNEWWFSAVLPYAGWQPFCIAWAANLEQDYQSVTAAEVNALAGKYLVDSNVFAVVGVSPGQSAVKSDQLGTGKAK